MVLGLQGISMGSLDSRPLKVKDRNRIVSSGLVAGLKQDLDVAIHVV